MKERILSKAPAIAVWLIMLWLSPGAGLAAAILAAGLWAATRSLPLAFCFSSLSFPAGVWLIDHPAVHYFLLAVALGSFGAWIYRAGFAADL